MKSIWNVVLLGLLLLSGTGIFSDRNTSPTPLISTTTAQLLPPSNISILSLDSSFHVTWIPSLDPQTAWQVVSVWDGATLVSSKVVSKSSNAAQTNGLMPGHSYTVRIQAMDAQGNRSQTISASATTDPQPPMHNAAFFENFNEMPGDLDANYFDVRTAQGTGLQPESIGAEKMLVFNSERHFHTQLIGGKQRAELMIRPRVPFDFANRVGTFQFEIDLAPVQHSEGKWFEIHLVKNIPWSSEGFGAGDGQGFPDSIEFSVRQGDGGDNGTVVNIPQITVNIGGNVQVFQGITRQMTPANIRVPVVLQVSQNSARMFINGSMVVSASGFTLPFTTGDWILAHRGWYGSRDRSTSPVILQLIHWETIQFDGPAGSYNPVVKTYLQPGCKGVVNYIHDAIEGCPNLDLSPAQPFQTINLNIPDNPAGARSVRLLFNGNADQTQSLTVNVNGNQMIVPIQSCCTAQNPYEFQQGTAELPTNWLRQGNNQLSFIYTGSGTARITQVEVEVVHNQQRVMENPVIDPMPMLLVTNQSFRIQRLPSDPQVFTATTYLYSAGSAGSVNYDAAIVSSETPWLSVSPASGTLESPALNGQLIPLVITVNFNGFLTDGDGEVGVIKITGGIMPLYIAVLAVNDGSTQRPTYISSFTNLNTWFNKGAIPDYVPFTNHANLPSVQSLFKAGW